MTDGRQEIKWSPRVPKWKLLRLYEREAQGIYDDELIDDIGTMLYMRCRDILTIHMALADYKVRCPRCDRGGKETLIERHGGREELLVCPQCGWSLTWGEYHRSFHRRQLNPGGAVPFFEAFVRDYWRAQSPREKMLAIDRVIHTFHYSLRDKPDLPTRPAGVNLISGKLKDVVQFLDELSGMPTSSEIQETHRRWQREYRATFWQEWLFSQQESSEIGGESGESRRARL